MTPVLATLIAARELLTPPERWTQEAHFRLSIDGDSHLLPPDDDDASRADPDHQVNFMKQLSTPGTCFCIEGAVYRCALDVKTAQQTMSYLDGVLGEGSVYWNDHPKRTHAEVIQLLDKAIAQ